ncbi:lipopolysaccharide heptosyltransferase I [Porticoccus litoralis]|uniref:Lipopolysaccharide heptosyltransferase 1 n=1 Tax=Porticoccus litoralis TaxID=434086 RepID=A0AAW8AZE0_9GAMM|nr:lipopolysaccharide heptosyltransferase I [Porticoccus litoralis]MDP1519693.1 lipopolysaccharide heptosyltransferase I [Porticoccus litoralis]
MQVLIVKLSSMGDLVQALPALTDAQRAIPGIQFDWAVDEAFAEIPTWHPTVRNTIKTAHRRWRKNLFNFFFGGELTRFTRELRQVEYDIVIDAQSNLKSSLVTWLTRGLKCGPDRSSVREFGAQFAYNQTYAIAKNQLAIDRWRQLFSQVLGYELPDTKPDFLLTGDGAKYAEWPSPSVELPNRPYLVFVHNASWDNKCWINEHWRQLIELAASEGFDVLLPWGAEWERQQAELLAEGFDHATVLPRLPLTDIASVLSHSSGAICVDTGLAHIAAALEVPMVTLYGPTDAALIGAYGKHSVHLSAQGFECTPCYKRSCTYQHYKGPEAQCLKTFTAQKVWREWLKVKENL